MSDPTIPPTPSVVPSYITGLVRTAISFGAGWLVSKGFINADQVPELIGGGLVLAAAAWSIYQKFNTHKTLTS